MRRGLVLLAVVCGGSVANADPRDDVLAAWEKSRGRLQTIRYTLSGGIENKADATVEKSTKLRPTTTPPPFHGIVLLDLPRRRHRLEETNPKLSMVDNTKYTSATRIWVSDGKTSKSLHPRAKNEWYNGRPDMHVSRGDLSTVDFPAHYHPLFFAHGFIATSRDIPSPGLWPVPGEREEFELHGTGVIGGRAHTIVRAEPFHGMRDEYWADLGRGGAIGRMITWVNKTNPYMRTDIDYQEVGGQWVLKRWTHTVSMNNRVAQVSRYEVTKVELNPVVSDAEFDIPIEPGYLVEEHVFPAKGSGLNPDYPAHKTTRVKPDGGKEVIAESGFLSTDGVPVPLTRPWWSLWWVWAAVGVMVAAVLVWVVWRRARRRAAGVSLVERG
jgi:hypothetical protein